MSRLKPSIRRTVLKANLDVMEAEIETLQDHNRMRIRNPTMHDRLVVLEETARKISQMIEHLAPDPIQRPDLQALADASGITLEKYVKQVLEEAEHARDIQADLDDESSGKHE